MSYFLLTILFISCVLQLKPPSQLIFSRARVIMTISMLRCIGAVYNFRESNLDSFCGS